LAGIDYGVAIANTADVVAIAKREGRRYRSGVRDAQARETRRRILDVARAAFLDLGFGGTTIRAVAGGAQVSVPTVEALFGTKARLLKAAIDVAIAGDDEPVAVLDRPWATAAREATSLPEFLAVVAGVVGAAQQRSAGLVLAVLEGASTTPELGALATQMAAQRAATAAWIVERVTGFSPLRPGWRTTDAVDTVWILLDPAVFDRLARQRGWTAERYQIWLADAVARLLVADGSAR
jgi:AcrR family transcriptional regulator